MLGADMLTTRLVPILLILGLLDPATAQEQPDQQYLDQMSEIHAAPDTKDRPGRVFVATPLTVLEQRGDWAQVSISGWTQADAERVVYAAPGIRVMTAALPKTAVKDLIFSDQITDPDTGQVWTRTELRGWLHQPVLQPEQSLIWDRAEPLFAKRCTACHQRRIPHHYTANQWTSHLKVMGPRTGLPKEDQFLIRTYLQHHAKDSDRLTQSP